MGVPITRRQEEKKPATLSVWLRLSYTSGQRPVCRLYFCFCLCLCVHLDVERYLWYVFHCSRVALTNHANHVKEKQPGIRTVLWEITRVAIVRSLANTIIRSCQRAVGAMLTRRKGRLFNVMICGVSLLQIPHARSSLANSVRLHLRCQQFWDARIFLWAHGDG